MAGKTSKFLGKVSRNTQQQKQKSSSFGYLNLPNGVSVFKEEPGRFQLDILPYEVTDERHPDRDEEFEIAIPGSLWYKRPFKRHNSIGSDNARVVCPSSIGKKCPICEYRAKLLKEGANWKDEEVRALRPSDRNLYVVVPIGHSKFDEVPHVWDISHSLFQTKLNDELEEDEENGVFPDLQDGKTLKIRFAEAEMGRNKFAETSRIDFEDRDPYKDSILDKVPNLDEILEIKSYAELERMFLQTEDAADEPDKERPRGTRSDRGDRTTRTREPEPEPEQEEQPARTRRTRQAEPESEAEEPPARTRRTRQPEPEPEDEPEPTPARTRRTRQPEPEPEDEPEPEEPPARVTRTRRNEEPAASGKNKCPAGYRFGHDADEKDECGSCKIWDACMSEREKLGV